MTSDLMMVKITMMYPMHKGSTNSEIFSELSNLADDVGWRESDNEKNIINSKFVTVESSDVEVSDIEDFQSAVGGQWDIMFPDDTYSLNEVIKNSKRSTKKNVKK